MSGGSPLRDKVVLITGGTGSFGSAFVQEALARHEPAAIRVYSRDELKQWEMQRGLNGDDRVRMMVGDVRDLPRLERAMRGVDVVIHAAALKQVPVCEYNPFEAVQTNVIGAENVISAAIENDVPLTIALSTDKAVNPVNLYGATKLCAEKLMTQGNSYSGDSQARFATVRYGNVVGSRGSVIPLFKKQALEGELTITDESMTRFWITMEQAVKLVNDALAWMQGGEIFVPRIPSMRVSDIATALAPEVPRKVIGIRPGEKVHETLITEEEARHAVRAEDHFAIYPSFPFWREISYPAGEELPPGFTYSSEANDEWLDAEQIRAMAEPIPAAL